MIYPFSGIGNSTTLAATTVNQRVAINTPGITQKTIRVVNESASPALVAFGDATVDATTAANAQSVLPGERIFSFPPSASNVAVALRSGAGNVQVQLGEGV